MRLWDSIRFLSSFGSSARPKKRAQKNSARNQKPKARRHRGLRLEKFEDRVLLSVSPNNPDRVWEDTLQRAIEAASDLNQYSVQQLQASHQWVVGLADGLNPQLVASLVGGEQVAVASGIKGAYVFQFPSQISWETIVARLDQVEGVQFRFPLAPQQLDRRLIPNDPLFVEQWHLLNTGQSGGTLGQDVRVTGVWDNYQGDGVVIGIVDDGIETTHPDLVANYRADLSYDYLMGDTDPQAETGDFHGTAVAGVAAASGNNSLGVTGAAFDAQLAALRLIGGSVTDLQIAQAIGHRTDAIQIYNNSWGPPDAGGGIPFSVLAGPGPLSLAALQQGITTGRGGLGSVYVWAAGNGLQGNDNSNYDGWANSRYTIAVAAVDHDGRQAWYSEPGANILVSAYSNGLVSGIYTTDRLGEDGYNVTGTADGDPLPDIDYTSQFGGTSSAAPLVSGIIALMLQANPNLTYRDVQYILAQTARMNDASDSGWTTNAAGYHINHKYGFGVVDAAAAVAAAQTWKPVGPELVLDSGTMTVSRVIPDNNPAGISSVVSVAPTINHVEWAEVTVDISHQSPGDLEIVLVSPSGTQSVLAEPHTHDPFDNGIRWTFTTARNWGESAGGDWTLIVRDRVTGTVGQLNSWRLAVYGQQIPSVPPDLVAVIPNEGSLIEEGTELNVAPRELILRFNEGQQLDPNTLGAIQFVRAGGDDSFAEGNEVVVPIGYIGIGDKPNEVIVRFAENLPDDKYHLVIRGTGANPLTNLDSPPVPFRFDPDLGVGQDLTLEFDVNLGPQILAVVPQPVYRSDIRVTVPPGNQITDGQTFVVSDGAIQVTFEFENQALNNGVQAGRIAVPFQTTDSAATVTSAVAAAIIGQGLNLTVSSDPLTAQITLSGSAAAFDPRTSKFQVRSLEQRRSVIEVYLSNDRLDANAATNREFYQLIFTQGTARPDDDTVVLPVSVSYDADANKVTLDFGQDLANLGTGAARLRIGSRYQVVQTWNMSEGADAGSSFYNSSLVSGFGNAGAPQSVIISGAIVPERYTLEWPGAVDEPGHRDLPNYDSILIEDHYLTGESSPDASTSIPRIPFYFPTGSYNLITEAQKQRAREIFAIYGEYLGIQFYESETGGLAIITGDLALMGLQSAPGGVGGVAGGGVAVMDYAENWGASEFGGGWFQVAMHEIGHLLGYGHSYDLSPFVIMGSSEDATTATGSFEPVFPGMADIVHGRHMYRPDSTDVDMYRFDLQERGMVSAEILAERMANSSMLDAAITLYRQVDTLRKYVVIENGVPVEKEYVETTYEVVARNDDFYSEDSALEIYLPAGTYFIGVSASGNTQYDPNIDDTGIGGVTQGAYKLRLNFTPGGVDPNNPTTFREPNTANPSMIIDSTGLFLDGDLDGVPGGEYNFWFNVQSEANTLFVDKLSFNTAPDGSLSKPFTTISGAFAAARPNQIVRIVGNNFANDDPNAPATLRDNVPYEIGRRLVDNAPMADGVRMEVPQGVTVMVDAGAMIKLFRSNITVGSLAEGIDRSSGALQVLGIPGLPVYFTSYYDESLGRDPEPTNNTTPASGDWGGIVFRNDLDYQYIRNYNPASGLPPRQVLEDQGIFLNYVSHADMRYGGGEVIVNGVRSVYNPIHMVEARPTILFNSISRSADAAMSADPNSFADTKFQSWDPAQPYTVEYDRVGPTIRGNYVVDNSINGLYVRIKTAAGGATKKLTTFGRWDDWDIVHYVPENLAIAGTPGGALQRASTAPSVSLANDFRIQTSAASVGLDGQYFSIYDGRTRVVFEFDNGDGVVAGRVAVPYSLTDSATQVAASLAAAINAASVSRGLEVTAGAVGANVNLTQRGAQLKVEGLGNLEARIDSRLQVDPGVIVKLQGSRIETEIGAQLIAEGRPGFAETVPGYKVVFTSVIDNRYGAGGTFNTAQNTSGQQPGKGDWGGIGFAPLSEGSIDQAIIAYAGGQTAIEGGFAGFDPIEIRQAHVRIANTRFEHNGANSAGDRNGRGFITPATIYVRGAQPVIVNNRFVDNSGHIVSVDVNALNAWEVPDWGRSTGQIDVFSEFDGNQGPLVALNRMTGNQFNAMEVRAGELTTQGVWDDTDIVHAVYGEIVIGNYHHEGGLRLQSAPTQSLVVKLWGQDAGFTASGRPLEYDDRIGGILQVVGQPGYPVVLTSLADDSVGAGLDIFGNPQYDTNGDGASTAAPGQWRSVRFDRYSHDRNLATIIERETATGSVTDINAYPQRAQYMGQLAPNEKAGDDNLRLGFDIYGAVRYDERTDSDVYSFDASAGTEIWIDIDRSTFALDTIIELIDADGNVLARSDNSLTETPQGSVTTLAYPMNRDPWIRSTSSDPAEQGDFYSMNPRDAGLRLVLPGPAGEVRTYYVRVRSVIAISQIPTGVNAAEGAQFIVSDDFQSIVFEFDRDGTLSDPSAVAVSVANGMTADQVAAAITTAINGQKLAKNFEITARYENGKIFLDGVRAQFNPLTSSMRLLANTAGNYQLQVRLREMQEVAGSTVKYADVRYATNGIEVLGFPQHHPLLGEVAETTAANDAIGNAQPLGNLLRMDRNTISVAGYLSGRTDVDWYSFQIDLQGIQSIGGLNDLGSIFSTIFDIDYADGMARPDLAIWVFDSQGRLILRSNDSNIADDMALVVSNAIEDLNRGSVWNRDPYIGPVYLPEGANTTYYVAVTSALATPQVLSSVIGGTWSADSTANPLVRIEPVNSVERIVEEHIDSGPASGITAAQQRLSLVPDEFKLGDVVFYTLTGTDLYTVDPFTGQVETDVTDWADPYLPGSPNIVYHDIAMRNDGRLMTVSQGPGVDFNPRYREFDTGNANNLAVDVDTGINIIRRDPGNLNNLQNDPNNSLYVEAMVHYLQNTGNLGRQVMIVGNVPNPDLGGGAGITSGRNLVWMLSPSGTAINHPAINNGQAAAGDRLFSNIVPIGQLFTAPTLIANPASQTDPIYSFGGGVQPRDFADGHWFAVTDAGGTTVNFEFDLGLDVRMDPQGAAAFRDGQTFSLVNVNNGLTYTFEFDSGPVVVLPASAGASLDGVTVTIWGSTLGGGTTSVTFEFDNNNTLTNNNNVRVGFNNGDTGAILANSLVNAINAQGAFTVVAGSVNNRVTLINDSTGNPPASSDPAQVAIQGTHGASSGTPISFEETWTSQQLGQQIESIVDSSAGGIDASYAFRSTTTTNPNSPGDRLTFLNASVFSSTAPLTLIAGAHDVTPGRVRVPIGAGYTPQQVAQAMANAINSAAFLAGATVSGATVELANVDSLNPVAITNAPQLDFAGEGVGGDITGMAYIGNTLYAVSNTGGLYYITNVSAYANGGSWGFRPVDPQSGPRFFTRVPGAGPQLHYIGQVVNPTTGQPIAFSGLATGPQNAEGGKYAETLFASDTAGNVYALTTTGALAGAFLDGAVSVNPPTVGNIYGIDFSPVDYNLWHWTDRRWSDQGHGVYQTYDDSRVPAEGYDPLLEGNRSYYFGLDDPTDGDGNQNQPGADNFTTNQNSDGSRLFTYNLPGGAHGSLTSGTFSLAGYSPADKPTLYFNYYAETENSADFDSVRVFISNDGANWTLMATNTDLNDANLIGPSRDTGPLGGYIREVIDLGGNWRQARLDLSQFAGLDNLRIRFDFSTASDMDVGNVTTTGEYLTAPDAAELHDGATFAVDGVTFEFDLGYALVIPNAAGVRIADGETITISDGSSTTTLEFDKNGTVLSGNVAVPIDDTMTARQLTDALAGVVNGLGLNLSAYVPGDVVFSGANGNRIFLVGAQTVTLGAAQILLEGSTPGQITASNVPVYLRPDMTQLEVSKLITDAVNRQFRATPNSIFVPNSATAAGLNNSAVTVTALDARNVPAYALLGFTTSFATPLIVNPASLGLPPGVRADYAVIVGLQGATTPQDIAARISAAINLLNTGAGLQISAVVLNQTVQLGGPQAAFDGTNPANPTASPLKEADLNQTTIKLDELTDSRGQTEPLMRLFGHPVTDSGPLSWSNALQGDTTSKNYGATARGNNRFYDFRRGQNNSFEGWYIDDIIIGFAERGEMITNAPAGNTGFDFMRAPLVNEPVVVTGSYQLEIRRGDEFGTLVLDPYRVVPLAAQANTNDRWTTGYTLQFPAASNIGHGDRFWINDGVREQTFVFLDSTVGTSVPLNPPLDGSEVPVYFQASWSAGQVANAVAAAVNAARDAGRLMVSAASINTSERVDLWGATYVGGSIGGVAPQSLQHISYGVVEGTGLPNETVKFSNGAGNPVIGERNAFREKGQIIVENTSVFHASEYGIRVEPAAREPGSNAPHPASGRTMNAPNQLVAGVTLQNNLVAFNTQGGIRISGEVGQPTGAIPFVRVVNNTVYGGLAPNGVGITVVNNAGPTLLNNVVANLNTGILVDASSNPNTVLGGNAYQGNNANVQGRGLGTFDRVLAAGAPLFVDPANYNFIPDQGSEIIDSSIDSLQERFAYYNSVLQPIGISASPIIAPTFDLYGQLRKDDPAVNPPPGGGLSVYKDRGAVDRVDFRGPTSGLIEPLDNDGAGVDRDRRLNDVFVAGQRVFRFAVKLLDEDGVGINDRTVVPGAVSVYRGDVLLEEGKDYFFQYQPVDDIIYLVPASGVWSIGHIYKIVLDNQAIRDLANNPLQPNRGDGTTFFTVNVAGIDFGDAPDGPYPTTLKNNGASHIIVPDLYLGSGVSSEADARQNATATGDTFDDGVLFDAGLLIGGDTQIRVVASAEGYLDAWIDLNMDGDWTDAAEKVFNSVLLQPGVNLLTVNLPSGLAPGQTFARFRLSSAGGLNPTGVAQDGEVEDYLVELVPYHEDYGDAPDSYGTTRGVDGARHRLGSGLYLGAAVDAELDGKPTVPADGDDKAGIDDEDGVLFLDALVPGSPVEVQVVVSQPNAYLQGWVDFNRDGDFADPGEQIFVNQPLASAGTHSLFFTVPQDAVLGTTYARFRISTDMNLAPTGFANDGEVEDYRTAVVDAPLDFGDAPAPYPTLAADGGARHRVVRGFHLGQSVDYELDGQPDATATGDDNTDQADEDGVIFNTPLLTGELATITVYASQSGGYLNAWIDYNADGDWNDPGEQIFADQSLAAGNNVLQFRVPRELESADTFARFRFSHTPGLLPYTPAGETVVPDGEVEDYLVRVIAGTSSISGYKFNDLNANGVWDRQPSADVPAVTILPPGAGNIILPAGDDMASGAIPLGFDFEFFGKAYNQIYVSTNGIVTFANPLSAFSAAGFPQGEPMLAPFWADADTRGVGQIRMQQGTSSRGNPVVQIDWVNVGYYNQHNDKRNTFSLYIEDDPGGDVVAFYYHNMEWTTGDGFGVNGFGAPGAQIGYDAGDGLNYLSVARPSTPADLTALLAQRQYAFRFDPNTGRPFGVEPGLPGVQVYVDLNNNAVLDSFEPVAVTQLDDPSTPNVDETGFYQFTGLFAGSYTVREVVPSGWIQTYPTAGLVLPDGQTRHLRAPAGSSITDGQRFTISNGTTVVTFEFDSNSTVTAGNRRIPFNTTDSATVIAASVMNAINAVAGFGVTATAEADLVHLAGSTVIFDPLTSPLVDATTRSGNDGSYSVTLATGENLTDVNFGNYKLAHVVVDDVAVAEGNSGRTRVRVTVEVSDSFGAPISFNYQTADGTATTANNDYIPASGTFVFTPQGIPTPTWNTELLTLNSVNDYDFSVWQDRVVWETFDGQDWEIYLFDGTSTRRLTDNTTDDRFASIHGHYVVWSGFDGQDYEIYLYDINTDSTRKLTDNDFDDKDPQVSDDLVAWWGNPGGVQQIFAYDIAAGGDPINISNNGFNNYLPVVSGRNVAWYAFDGFDNEIYVYAYGSTRRVTNNTLDDRFPRIDGNNVVWQQHDGGDWEIALYDIATNTTTILTSNNRDDMHPEISGNNVVWEGNDGTDLEIYYINLNLGPASLRKVTDNNVPDELPRVHGNELVWHAFVNGNWEVYYTDLSTTGIPRNISNNPGYDWYPVISEDLAVWRRFEGGNYEIVVARQQPATAKATIELEIVGDTRIEADENFFLNISSPQLAVIDDPQAQIWILNDDGSMDYGDAPAPYPTTLADNGARHLTGSLRLGARIDAEGDGRPSVAADGDDTFISDDEDGVVFGSQLLLGGTAVIDVTASAAGKLDAWIDFNRDGDWNDPGERIFSGRSLSAGVNTLSFDIPSDARVGDTYARFRFSSQGVSAPTGYAPDGEVEDYRLTLAVSTAQVVRQGRVVFVTGGSGEDQVSISTAGTLHTVIVNGTAYNYSTADVDDVRFDGAGGRDTVTFSGTAADELFVLQPTAGTMTRTGFKASAVNVERFIVFGNGGTDAAQLYDSTGDDALEIRPGRATMVGPGYSYEVNSVDFVHGYASTGNDRADLYDTTGDDTFTADANQARLVGPGYLARAKQFDAVRAFSSGSGADSASITGATADDMIQTTPTSAELENAGFSIAAYSFDEVTIDGNGGNDVAQLYDSAGDDWFIARPGKSTLTGPGYAVTVNNVGIVHAYATTGLDVAQLYDTTGNDTFIMTPDYARVTGTGYMARAKAFDYVHGYSIGGFDTARMYGSSGKDDLIATPEYSRLKGPGYYLRAKFFERVEAYGGGGVDTANVYDSAGVDHLQATPDYMLLQNPSLPYYVWLTQFEKVKARGNSPYNTKHVEGIVDYLIAKGFWTDV
ncbi:GEVED domain-containing protein [Thermopirellula anaerolimosa]